MASQLIDLQQSRGHGANAAQDEPAATRAGVDWASSHKLRHGVATMLAEQGYEAHDIARMLRHADGGAPAQRTYMHPKVRSVGFPDETLRHG